MKKITFCDLRSLASSSYPLTSFILHASQVFGLCACIYVCSSAWAQAPPDSVVVGTDSPVHTTESIVRDQRHLRRPSPAKRNSLYLTLHPQLK